MQSPAKSENAEIIILIPINSLNVRAIFFAVTAGTIRRELINKTPTKLIPTAMVVAMSTRSNNSIFFFEIFDAVARSGAIEARVSCLRSESVVPIMRIATIIWMYAAE